MSARHDRILRDAAGLPSGTVTFAFTDIEGSTVRWDRDTAAMEDAVRRHDAILRTAIAAAGGSVFKTIGDAFCAAFRRPEEAVAAMLDAQRALAAEDFSAVGGIHVRAALHTGTADERDGDYFGPAVNRVARLLAIGNGGQVLLSAATAHLVQGNLPPHARLHDAGDHRLKDLSHPEHVYVLHAPDLPPVLAPLHSLGLHANNLPLEATSFVGRETEIAEIRALLDAHRLVTLVGSGGIGKTRTSLQVAANVLEAYDDGVWFVELAPLTSGDYVPAAIAQALGLRLPAGDDPLTDLVHLIAAKRALVVFDNCEHLMDPIVRTCTAVLRACPNVTILASSRQHLGIAGEAAYRMPTLGVPLPGSTASAGDAMQFEAVALFFERASAADSRFSITDANAAAIVEICRRLDGIPLAIELAAVRVKILSPRQLYDRLDERFRVLTGGSRDVLPRQQTLRAMIDWSYDLLDERERSLFRRLGIFVNGFALEGALAVGVAAGIDEFDVFDVLASLVDKSLVLADVGGESARYRFLESTRAYALLKLDAAGERHDAASDHARYLRDRFAQAQVRFEQSTRWFELSNVLESELEDVRSALDWSARENPLTGAELLGEIRTVWWCLNLQREALRRLEAFLALVPQDEGRVIVRLTIAIAWLCDNTGHFVRAFEAASQAEAAARRLGDRALLTYALHAYAATAMRLGRQPDAQTALAEAETYAEALSSAYLTLRLLNARAFMSAVSGDYERAAREFVRLRDASRGLGDELNEWAAVLNIAELENVCGRTANAVAVLREMLPGYLAHPNREAYPNPLTALSSYLSGLGEHDEASAVARRVIAELAARDPDHPLIPTAVEHLALASAVRGDTERAAALAGYAGEAVKRHGFTRESTDAIVSARLHDSLREQLAPDVLARRLSAGAMLGAADAVAYALEPAHPRT